jgi:1-acyl-sn-glycerol-3-phosphate acyltransferase
MPDLRRTALSPIAAASLLRRAALPASLRALDRSLRDRLRAAPARLNRFGFDPYGFAPASARWLLLPNALLYRYWFRVETYDIERVPKGRVLLIANHGGQFAYDGAMLAIAMLLEAEPPRLARGMGEYFLFRTPGFAWAGPRMGSVVGTPANCVAMLEADECVMVFPEGARGANKPYRKRYQLQSFGTGFLRIALQTGTPIVPVGIVGSEEQQPGFANLEGFGRLLNLPSFPVTISSPWLGLFGPPFALPVKYRMYFGEPLRFEGDANEEDEVVGCHVERVRRELGELLARGLRERRGIFR